MEIKWKEMEQKNSERYSKAIILTIKVGRRK